MNDFNSQIEQLSIDRTEVVPTFSKIRYLLGFIIILCLALIVFTLSKHSVASSKENVTITSQQNNNVQQLPKFSHVTKQPVQSSVLDASGHIVARRIATVSSRITGKIIQLNIEEGQQVKKDDVLAELDDRQAQIAFQLAGAELSAREADYEELDIIYKHEKQLANRREKLALNHLISDEVVESSVMKTQQLAAQLKSRKALITQSEQRLELARYQLEQHKIRAPFNAVVISKNAQIGELISAGTSGGGFIRTGVGTIVDMSSLEIEVEVGESYINRVYKGQKVTSTLDAYPKWQINSEVVAIIPTADRQKATIKVRVKLLKNDIRILPDMGIKVSFLEHVDAAKSIANN